MPSKSNATSASPSAPRGRLFIAIGVVLVVLIAAAAVLYWQAPGLFGRQPALGDRLAEATGAAPALAAAPAGDHFLVAWPGDKGLVVQPLGAGGPGAAHSIREVKYVAGLVPVPGGALAAMVDQFVRVNLDGAPVTGLVSLVEGPPGAYRAFVMTGDSLAMAASMSSPEGGAVFFQTFNLDGKAAGAQAKWDAGSTHPAEVGLARLGNGDFVVAWTRAEPAAGVFVAVVKADGTPVGQAVEAYTGVAGAEIGGCAAAPTADGNVVVVWQDSSPGAREIFALGAGAAGALGPAQQVSGTPGQDDVAPSVAFDGKRTRIAWLSGLNGPVNQRKGTGSVSVLEYGGKAPAATYAGGGSIESYAIAAQGDTWVLATAMREKDKWGIYARVLTAAP